jgi:hypothetical protein
MLKTVSTSIVAYAILACITARPSIAQGTDFKVGETIYVNPFYSGCVKATVTGADPKYSVHILEGAYKDKDTFYSSGRISECPQAPQQAPQQQAPQQRAPQQSAQRPAQTTPNRPAGNAGGLNVGDRVDVYLTGNQEGKNRGTIVEANGNQYKVHYDGCAARDDVWENATLVHPAATIAANSPDITFLTGKWAMFTPSYPTTVIRGNDVYREYGMGGKAPPLQINGDGTYVWYYNYGKPPVTGRWTSHPKIEGARFGTETENGVIIKDPSGGLWKVYRRKSTSDNDDHITARTMCSAQTVIGTRIR